MPNDAHVHISPHLATLAAPVLAPQPREAGLTSVLDKGVGLHAMRDLVALAGPYMDVVKLGWGTSVLYPSHLLAEKITLLRTAGIAVCPGGTLLEIAWAQGRTEAFFAFALEAGFNTVEVSDGTYALPTRVKLELIERAAHLGFRVVSEVGKKMPQADAQLALTQRLAMVRQELEAGAWKVILEGRESGTVGIYDSNGAVQANLADALVDRFGVASLVFEAPQKSQQVWLIQRYGAEVNLGNVPPDEALSVATLRCGLRSDTAQPAHTEMLDDFQEQPRTTPRQLAAV